MSFKQHLAANRWLRAEFAVLIALVAYMPLMVVLATSPAWAAPPVLVLMAAGGVCWRMARRVDDALAAAVARDEAEARELRTPRAPNAGPDQCPVCGGFGLTDLAADDAFMERGPDRAKVVAWGSRRAHWDCAELVPHVAPPHFEPFKVGGHGIRCACKQCERAATHPGAYYRCKFCGYYRRADSLDAAKEKLIAHAKECPKRPKPTAPEPVVTGKLRASIDPQPFRWRGMEVEAREAALAPCRPTAAETAWREALERLIWDERRS